MSWLDLAGPKHSYSAIAKNGNGRLELFALTEAGDLHHCWQLEPGDSGTWSEWRSLGRGDWNGVPHSTFAVGLSGKGGLELFLVADSAPTAGGGQIFHNRQTDPNGGEGEWTGWHTLDASESNGWNTHVGPTVIRNADGLLELFVMLADRGVYEEYWWSDYTSSTGIGHYSQTEDGKWKGPEVRQYIETCIEVEGRDDYLCRSDLPVRLVPALNSRGRLELFATVGDLEAKRRGVPGLTHIPVSLWHAWQAEAPVRNWWDSSFSMPGTRPDARLGHTEGGYHNPAVQPVVALDHDGRLELFLLGVGDQDIWVRQQNQVVQSGWSSWRSIGRSREWRHPVVVGDQHNFLTVFASSMTSGAVWYLAHHLNDHNETVWSEDWQPIGDDRDTSGEELLHGITNSDGRIELFASGPDNLGFRHKYQDSPGKWL
jgi:hypothetical protein